MNTIKAFGVFLVASLAVTGCQTGVVEPSNYGAKKVPITAENSDEMVGWWEGKWTASNGQKGALEVHIERITDTGRVFGSRMYTSSSLDTVGQIRNGQLELDVEKSDSDRIVLNLFMGEDGEPYMEGTYQARSGDGTYAGEIKKLRKVNY